MERLIDISLERGWQLEKAIGRAPNEGISGELEYTIPGSDTIVYLRDDLLLGFPFITVIGPDQANVAADLSRDFDPWPEPDLLAWWDRAEGSGDIDDKVDAVLYLGTNAGESVDERYMTRIEKALSDPDKDVRNAAVVAAAYTDWRVFRDRLAEIAQKDLDPKARERAEHVVRGWRTEDGG